MLTIRMYLRMIVKGDRAIKGECGSEAKRRIGIERRGGCGWAVAIGSHSHCHGSTVPCVLCVWHGAAVSVLLSRQLSHSAVSHSEQAAGAHCADCACVGLCGACVWGQ
jgi:hypothetical protein